MTANKDEEKGVNADGVPECFESVRVRRLGICFRYGRPIFCTCLDSPSEDEAIKTLERFAMNHVFWFTKRDIPEESVTSFKFIPIVTEY